MTATALKLQVGARTLASIRRRLQRVSIGLDDAIAGRVPALPPLARDAHGYLVTSLAQSRLRDLTRAAPGMLVHVRQHYTRYHADLRLGFDGYWAQLSGNTRSQLKRKARRIADVSGGGMRIDRFRAPDELERFHREARQISVRTYQERLLGGGLPDDDAFVRNMLSAAAADRVRAWLLQVGGEPAAYLYCEGRSGILHYDHVGHDPAFSPFSPGSVLMMEAFRDLMEETPRRFERFDFTEGQGQHKRAFATGGVPCVDVLLLRPSLSNRLTVATLAGFDRAVGVAKDAARHPALAGIAQKVRRAA